MHLLASSHEWPSLPAPSLLLGLRHASDATALSRPSLSCRPQFNHAKVEARDGFVVGVPLVKSPPVLAYLAVSDVMTAFKQARGGCGGWWGPRGASCSERAWERRGMDRWMDGAGWIEREGRLGAGQWVVGGGVGGRDGRRWAAAIAGWRAWAGSGRGCGRLTGVRHGGLCGAQAASRWPAAQPSSGAQAAQSEAVQSFVTHVLRESHGPLAPGVEHEPLK
jgi:hypothetical protein